jgi:hypothetical protein
MPIARAYQRRVLPSLSGMKGMAIQATMGKRRMALSQGILRENMWMGINTHYQLFQYIKLDEVLKTGVE